MPFLYDNRVEISKYFRSKFGDSIVSKESYDFRNGVLKFVLGPNQEYIYIEGHYANSIIPMTDVYEHICFDSATYTWEVKSGLQIKESSIPDKMIKIGDFTISGVTFDKVWNNGQLDENYLRKLVELINL